MIRMSSPDTTSGLSVEASFSASKQIAGRKFANSSRSLRRRRSPRSGFLSKELLSHLGPPTAPNRTASAACARFIVASVTATPSASSAAPPTNARSIEKDRPRFFAIQWMTRSVSAITSGPMPSPGKNKILYVMLLSFAEGEYSQLHPRFGLFAARLECGNLVLVAQRQLDVVPAVEQALLAEGVDFEFEAAAVGATDFLLLEIDADDGIGAAFRVVHQFVDIGLRQHDRQNAVLEAVVVEDVGEGRRDNAAYAEIEQRPGRVLARRAAAEIRARDEDLRVSVCRLVEHEVGILGAVRLRALLEKQRGAEPGAFDGFQELLGDDHVGIDVDHRKRCGNAR